MPSRRDDEPLETTSPLIADRAETPTRAKSFGKVKKVPAQSSSGTVKLMLLLAVIGVVGLAAWIAQLQKQLIASNDMLGEYQQKVIALENRLSITDESMLQSDSQFQDKVRFLDLEVRKLWDNVWKKTKADLAEHDKQLAAQKKQIAAQNTAIANLKKINASNTQKLNTTNIAISALDEQLDVASDNSAAITQFKAQLNGVTKSLESLQKSNGSLTSEQQDLLKRVQETEEWVDSFNGYRREVNQKLLALQGQ